MSHNSNLPICELCNGTGYYGDNGPGKKGNSEWQPCECSYRSEGHIFKSLGIRVKVEGNLVIIKRECFRHLSDDYEIALDSDTLLALKRVIDRIPSGMEFMP